MTIRDVETQSVAEELDPRRWKALFVLAIVQVLLLLDATVVNVALPSIQRDLEMSAAGLTWAVSSYLLTAGCLLFTGGKLADMWGRRRMFAVGTAVFAGASVVAGFAVTSEMLIVGRALQGVGEALAAPAALALVTSLFTSQEERAKAFGIWGSLAGLGSTLGVLLGGVLVQAMGWRSIFLINPILAAIALVLAFRFVTESKSEQRSPLNLRSAVLVSGGLVAVINGLMTASSQPWTTPAVWAPLAVGIALLVAFVVTDRRSEAPMLPRQFFNDKTRIVGYSTVVANASASAAVFFVLVLYMQNVLGYSPLKAGLAWLPFCLMFMPGLFISMSLMGKRGLRPTLFAGLLVSAVGVGLMARLPLDGVYWIDVLPAMLVTALGFGMTGPAMQNAATSNLGDDAGLGSGVVTTIQQLGQAVGLSVLVAAGLAVTQRELAGGTPTLQATTDGHQAAFLIGAIVLGVGAVVVPAIVREPANHDTDPDQ